ncbi:MAG: glycosyltransferase family 2 protein [Maricaulis sp.]|nr:glycosyltransferase family 2 protein [Maricaulis sp.]
MSWRTGKRLMESVKSVLAAPNVDEFVLVNHDNPDEVVAELRDLAAENRKFTLLETGENLGFGKGCNIGAEAASGDLLLFLNPDAVLVPSTAERLKESARRMNGGDWIIGGRILNNDGTEQRGARRGELTPVSAASSFMGLDRISVGPHSIHWEKDPLPEEMILVPAVSGAAMMMRRDVFEKIGGFDERYFLHVEDIDLCRTLREHGGEVWFEPRADILHYGGTSESSPWKVETHKASGFVKYFWKFYPGPLQRAATLLLSGPIFLAIWARVLWMDVRSKLGGLFGRSAKSTEGEHTNQAAE